MKVIMYPAQLTYLHNILEQVDKYLAKKDCTPEFISETDLIIEELFTNTVHYAYAHSNHEPVCIFVLDENDGILKIRRIDYGAPFDPTMTKRPDTHLSYQERKIGGLGMHLIRHYSSALKYRRNKDRNILTLYRVMRYNQITEG